MLVRRCHEPSRRPRAHRRAGQLSVSLKVFGHCMRPEVPQLLVDDFKRRLPRASNVTIEVSACRWRERGWWRWRWKQVGERGVPIRAAEPCSPLRIRLQPQAKLGYDKPPPITIAMWKDLGFVSQMGGSSVICHCET